MVVFVIADARSGNAPNRAVLAVFSPSGFIGLHRRAGADLLLECIQVRLHLLFEPVQELHDLANADADPMQGEQVHLDLANGQTHHRAQGGDQTSQSHADASLPDHLLVEIHRSFIPVVASGTPPLGDAMFGDLDWGRLWHIDDLSAARQTQTAQMQLTLWAHDQPMLHDLGGRGAWPPSIIPRVTL